MWILILTCCAIEAALLLADNRIIGPPNLRNLAYESFAFWPVLLQDATPRYPLQPLLMFGTYSFLHAGVTHLAFNMVSLWSLGRIVVQQTGTAGFLLFYGVSTVAGAICYAMFATTIQPMVGASGALFGLLGAILLWTWHAQPSYGSAIRATWRVFAFLILYNVVMYYVLGGALAWETHLGGFWAGWLLARFVGMPD